MSPHDEDADPEVAIDDTPDERGTVSDVDRLMEFAVEWGALGTEFEEGVAIGGAAANATSRLARQTLEGERRTRSIPRKDRKAARGEIRHATESGYQVVRFLFRVGGPRLSGYDTPSATQTNMSRIMDRASVYSSEELAQVLRYPPVTAHALEEGHVSDLSGPLGVAFGDDARRLKTYGYITGMRIGLAEQIEFGPSPAFEPETTD